MSVLIDNSDLYVEGLRGTVSLTVAAALLAIVLGTALAACRVSPVPSLRAPAAFFVNLMQNLPLTLLFFLVVFGLPRVEIRGLSYWQLAVIALGLYTSAFICEVLRSGINTVAAGQAEAARSLGMNFSQNLRLVILPQAVRSVIGPIGSTLIALTKNTSVATAFSVTELTGVASDLNELGAAVQGLFGVAVCYLVLILFMRYGFERLERKVAFAR